MDIEILKDKLNEDTFKTVKDALNVTEGKLADISKGDFVSSSKYGALQKQYDDTKALLDDKSKEYDDLKKTAGDNTALQNQIDKLKTDFESQRSDLVKNYEAQIKKSKIENRIISDYKPKDINDILPHLDFEKIKVNDDGINGLKEQMDELKKTKSYYFGNDDGKPNGGASGLDHGGKSKDDEDDFLKGFNS